MSSPAEHVVISKITETHTISAVSLEVVRLVPKVRDNSGLTLILLHEGLGSVAMWGDFPEVLARNTGCEVIVYSRAGYGKSGPAYLPRDVRYMHDEGLVVLPGLIDVLGVKKPLLLGHSDGASIALICAGGTNYELAGLIVMAPHIMVEKVTVNSIKQAKLAWRNTNLASRLAKYHDDAWATFIGWNDIWLNLEFFEWNIEGYLPSIQVPVLAIQGEDDEYGTMAQIDGIEKAVAQSELLKLPECRHSPHKDQKQAVLDAVGRFITERVVCDVV